MRPIASRSQALSVIFQQSYPPHGWIPETARVISLGYFRLAESKILASAMGGRLGRVSSERLSR